MIIKLQYSYDKLTQDDVVAISRILNNHLTGGPFTAQDEESIRSCAEHANKRHDTSQERWFVTKYGPRVYYEVRAIDTGFEILVLERARKFSEETRSKLEDSLRGYFEIIPSGIN